MADLNKLSRAALRSAMRGGTRNWGQQASATEHVRYSEEIADSANRRRKCRCGCGRRHTHIGMANGIGLTWGCELHVARWVRDPFYRVRRGGGDA